MEERFIENDFVIRLPYQFSYDKPLQGEKLDPGELYGLHSNDFLVLILLRESGKIVFP
jgi:hypothetical protein